MKSFDYVNSISKTKKNMMQDTENDALAEKAYVPYIVNKALSYFPDTILHANLMNQNYHLNNRAQYTFLLNSIRPKKRFAKWVQDASNEDLNTVCAYYDCNTTRGQEYLSLLSSEQIEMIKKELETGGIKNESNRKSGRNRATK
jgi:hypothetical protein